MQILLERERYGLAEYMSGPPATGVLVEPNTNFGVAPVGHVRVVPRAVYPLLLKKAAASEGDSVSSLYHAMFSPYGPLLWRKPD